MIRDSLDASPGRKLERPGNYPAINKETLPGDDPAFQPDEHKRKFCWIRATWLITVTAAKMMR